MAQAQSIFIPKAPTASDLAALDYFTARDAIFPDDTPPAGIRNKRSVVPFPEADSFIYFTGVMGKDWGESFLSLDIFWTAPAVIGDVVWFVAWERLNGPPGSANLDVNAFAADKSVVSTAPGSTGDVQRASLLFTQAEAAGIKAGDPYRLRIRRDADVLLDTLVGAAQLFVVATEGTP